MLDHVDAGGDRARALASFIPRTRVSPPATAGT